MRRSRISWRSSEERRKFLEAYDNFVDHHAHSRNLAGREQSFWVEAKFEVPSPLNTHYFEVAHGTDYRRSRSAKQSECWQYLWTLVGLRWAYELYVSSISAVVHLPLHKVITMENGGSDVGAWADGPVKSV